MTHPDCHSNMGSFSITDSLIVIPTVAVFTFCSRSEGRLAV